MLYVELKEGKDLFSLKKDKDLSLLYNSDYILYNFFELFFCMKGEKVNNSGIVSCKPEKVKAKKVVMKKLRVSNIVGPFDTLTFSEDFIDRVDDLLDLFDYISEHQLFLVPIDNGLTERGYKQLPVWFNTFKLNSIADWMVAHFEIRIVHLLVN